MTEGDSSAGAQHSTDGAWIDLSTLLGPGVRAASRGGSVALFASGISRRVAAAARKTLSVWGAVQAYRP